MFLGGMKIGAARRWIVAIGLVALCVWSALNLGVGTVEAQAHGLGHLPDASQHTLLQSSGTFLYFFPAVSVEMVCPTTPLQPVDWDPRLGRGPNALPRLENVRLIAASVAQCQRFWRVVKVKFEDIDESGNDHTIYVMIVDENGNRVSGQKLLVTSDSTGEVFPDQPVEKDADDTCSCNYSYPMFGDGYNVQIVGGLPSDEVAGMIMPLRRHVNYKITFQLTINPRE